MLCTQRHFNTFSHVFYPLPKSDVVSVHHQDLEATKEFGTRLGEQVSQFPFRGVLFSAHLISVSLRSQFAFTKVCRTFYSFLRDLHI